MRNLGPEAPGKAAYVGKMQELYREPIKPELIGERIRQINEADVTSCASITPQRTDKYLQDILAAEREDEFLRNDLADNLARMVIRRIGTYGK